MTPPLSIAGPWFEDFHVGLEFDAPALTLTDGHAALYGALFGDRLRLPLDHATAARVTGVAAPLAHPLLAINVAIGQSTWASQRVKANLFYRGLQLLQPPRIGDTLSTRTRVVGMRQNKAQPGRAATGVVALEITTTNQHGDTVLHGWRCPMIPCRDPGARTGHADDVDAIGNAVTAAQLAQRLPAWDLATTSGWLGRRAHDLAAGQQFEIEARDTVTCAPELVRSSLNMAMAHTDAKLSYLGERLVYGGHVIFMAFAQATRALPNLLTVLAWESCDHTAPVIEGDRLRSRVTVREVLPQQHGALLRLAVETWAARGPGDAETETRVLDWQLWAWSV
jgi:2-methylfumaryl-CoA hydratase